MAAGRRSATIGRAVEMTAQMSSGSDLLERSHVHADGERVTRAAEQDSTQRAHISVIAAPRDRHMAEADDNVVGRIEIDPAVLWTIHGKPGVRRVRPHETRLARRRIGEEIAADISRRESE